MKCRYCEEEMWVNGLTGFICAYCGTDLTFDTQNKKIIWTIEEHKDKIEVINDKGNILKQL
jgi:transcription initiation factor IIE alpha subunit